MAAEATAEGGQITGGAVGGTLLVATSSENFSSKRQRRPSVRLGEIGGGGDQQTYGLDSHARRHHAAAGKLNNHHGLINPSDFDEHHVKAPEAVEAEIKEDRKKGEYGQDSSSNNGSN